MRKTIKNQIMKKPLFALAIIAFGIGIAIYTNARGFKEGNATMGETTAAPPPPPAETAPPKETAKTTTIPAATAPVAIPATAAPTMPSASDIQAVINSPAVKKLLGNGALSAVESFMDTAITEPMGVMTQPRM